MTIFFRNVRVTTNAFLLSEEVAQALTRLKWSGLSISLCYFDKDIYEREIGMNYDVVMKNIKRYLEIKKENGDTSSTKIHIFDNKYNSEMMKEAFINTFEPLTTPRDNLVFLNYIDLTDNGIEPTYEKNKKVPCRFLWETIMVDLDGNIFPCCMGVWKKFDSYLTVGKDTDSLVQIMKRIIEIRKKQICGDYGSCVECATLYQNALKYYPTIYYRLGHYENKKLKTKQEH